ncbi:hypothetical protein A0H81_12658 [Grifola frondosa]|uniref:Uncharacterized protein n=1 Tax=Grifola frondosa TaxID=5627 RepID=A0A1C7LRM1_GRIFR|nr:hypothetical protein A0H81_12658 [Grifola frondosa]
MDSTFYEHPLSQSFTPSDDLHAETVDKESTKVLVDSRQTDTAEEELEDGLYAPAPTPQLGSATGKRAWQKKHRPSQRPMWRSVRRDSESLRVMMMKKRTVKKRAEEAARRRSQ